MDLLKELEPVVHSYYSHLQQEHPDDLFAAEKIMTSTDESHSIEKYLEKELPGTS
jgi:hypothetical protein